jgi:hypothetical protein
MHTIRIPLVVTPEDRKRAAFVKSAEEGRITAKTPDFMREGNGRCRTVGDPDDFLNDDTRGQSGRDARNRARAVCRSCPFMMDCRAWAEASKQTGIFGAEWFRAGLPIGKV